MQSEQEDHASNACPTHNETIILGKDMEHKAKWEDELDKEEDDIFEESEVTSEIEGKTLPVQYITQKKHMMKE